MFRDSQLTDQRAAGKIGVELLQNHVGIRPEAFEINHSPLVGQTPDEDILRRRQVGAQAQFLMNKAYADILGFFGTPGGNRRAFKQDLALRGRKHAADDVHEGRFPGTILAAQRVNLARPHLELYLIQRPGSGKDLCHTPYLQPILAHTASSCSFVSDKPPCLSRVFN